MMVLNILKKVSCVGMICFAFLFGSPVFAENGKKCLQIQAQLDAAERAYKVAERKAATDNNMLVHVGYVSSYLGGSQAMVVTHERLKQIKQIAELKGCNAPSNNWKNLQVIKAYMARKGLIGEAS